MGEGGKIPQTFPSRVQAFSGEVALDGFIVFIGESNAVVEFVKRKQIPFLFSQKILSASGFYHQLSNTLEQRSRERNKYDFWKKMNDSHCACVSKIEEKFEEADRVSDDNKTNEACVKDKLLDDANNLNKNSEFGILKEQNFFVDQSGLNSLFKLYSNKNCTNGAYISSKKEKLLAGMQDVKKLSNDFADSNQNTENTIFAYMKVDSKENNDFNIKNTPKKFNMTKEVHPNELNGSSTREDNSMNNMLDSSEVIYYAVHIPTEFSFFDVLERKVENLHVYTDKEEVLKVVKLNKKARFKQFKTRKEAEEFAIRGAEIISYDGSSAIPDNEKVMPFKRPKTEDIIQFRKDIERGNFEAVREKIFENPKYLVSNGDTPSILQEGSRYNALHVASKSKNAKITRLILDSITRLDFIGYLYDDNDIKSCLSRSQILLDRYLNTPDKGANETPLHLAVKHGAVEVVQVLLSYSQCQKNNVFNRYNKLPKDIICSRVSGPCEEAKAAIASMLEEQFFVPVLRSEDNSLQPRVGEPFSINSPLKLEKDLLSPRLEIQAYAGPMNKEKADAFIKKWKTPSRWVKDANSPLALRLRDTEKGLEKTGRNLASEFDVPWQEYWSFLDTFVDISSEAGLDLLENYLKNRFQQSFIEVQQKKYGINTPESNKNSIRLINDLCEAFEMCGSQEKQLNLANQSESPCSSTSRSKKSSLNSNFSQRENGGKKSNESSKNCGKNPIVYVERSCEVFGKRIGAAINSCVLFENHSESLKESLETQIKHLQTLIKSYKEDTRFQSVDFQLIHSRVAAVAIQNLQNVTNKSKQSILMALKGIDWSDGALSDDEDLNYNFRNENEWLSLTTKQLHCLVKHLIMQLHDYEESERGRSSPVWTESDCQMLWIQATPCKCVWSKTVSKRSRGGLKRKQLRGDFERDSDVSPRKIQSEEEKDFLEEYVDTSTNLSEESEDSYSTPPSGNSDSEEEPMEDVMEIPNTFIHQGSLPTKTDYDILEAIEKVDLSPEKHPYIYLWRHILLMQPKSTPPEHHHHHHNVSNSESPQRKALNFDSPVSSPCKVLDRSLGGSSESPLLQETLIEPWERVTGPYSPRRSSRSSLSMLYYHDSPSIGR